MRWIVLFFWLLGGVLYAIGAFTPSPIEPQAPAQTAATVSPDDPQKVSKSGPESGADPSVVSNEPDNTPKAQNGTTPAPETQNFPRDNSAASGAAPVPDDPGQTSWGHLLRGAPVHSGPSVSSDTLGYVAAGSAMQLLERQNGWARVVDPATSRQGWIYDEHITVTEGPSGLVGAGDNQLALQELEEPKPSFKANNGRKKYAKKRWRKPLRFVLRFRR